MREGFVKRGPSAQWSRVKGAVKKDPKTNDGLTPDIVSRLKFKQNFDNAVVDVEASKKDLKTRQHEAQLLLNELRTVLEPPRFVILPDSWWVQCEYSGSPGSPAWEPWHDSPHSQTFLSSHCLTSLLTRLGSHDSLGPHLHGTRYSL